MMNDQDQQREHNRYQEWAAEKDEFESQQYHIYLEEEIIKLEAQVEQYQMYEKMIVASTIQAQEYFDGNVSAKSLGKFREMLHEALEGGE